MYNLNSVDTQVSIAGQKCHFYKLALNQKFNDHHSFTIEVNYEEFDSMWMENPTKIIKLIGEPVTISMVHRQTKEENLFSGIITNAAMVGKHGEQNNIVISGYSETIKLDGNKTMDSFTDKSLDLIVKEAVSNSGNGAEINVNPAYSGSIDYISQYNETAFEFLNRLSYLYGEWFFYNGTTIYFGKPNSIDPADLIYDMDLTHFHLSANLLPSRFNRYNYLVHMDKDVNVDAPDSVNGVRGYLKVALDKSQSVYTSEADLPLEASILGKENLDALVEVEKTRSVANMLVFTGGSYTCKVKVGRIVNIKLPPTMRTTVKEVESFLITEVNHIIDQNGYYSNTFKGIPSGMENVPVEKIPMPVANPQIATVMDNADDKGRIKVQFQWQKKNNKSTNWLRVQTPDAGSSEAIAKNRGFVFIPEKGDQVMVGFEYGDPNKPYVSGSMFPETKGNGGYNDNMQKSIITRSGIKIVFNDVQGSLHIQDPSGNTWSMDGQGNINVKAPKAINLDATDITLNAFSNLMLNVGKDFSTNVGEITKLNSAILHQFITGSLKTYSLDSFFHSATTMKIEANDFSTIGKEKLILHSDKETTLNSLGIANVHGKTKSSYTNSPLNVLAAGGVEIEDVIVEFRPVSRQEAMPDGSIIKKYDGEFGFDWLRNDGTTILGQEDKYESPLLVAARNPHATDPDFTGNDALDKLKAQFDEITVKGEANKYYVPCLNIYPKTAIGDPSPPSKISLELLIRVKVAPRKVEIELGTEAKKYLKINNGTTPIQVTDIAVTPKKRASDKPITIECIKEFNKELYIDVYSYPPLEARKPNPGKIPAGKLKLLPNDRVKSRGLKNIVFVKVKTKINGTVSESGNYDALEKEYLSKAFYQSLLYAKIEDYTLNLEDDLDFRTGGKYMNGANLNVNMSLSGTENPFKRLRELMIAKDNKYSNYIFAFCVGMSGGPGLKGMAEPIPVWSNPAAPSTASVIDLSAGKCTILFPERLLNIPRYKQVAAHESYHALGLWHTWREFTSNSVLANNFDFPKIKKNKAFIFNGRQTTKNIMTYNFGDMISTWKWQWEIVNPRK